MSAKKAAKKAPARKAARKMPPREANSEALPSVEVSSGRKQIRDALLLPFCEAIGVAAFAEQVTEAVQSEFELRLLAPLGITAGDLGIKLTHQIATYGKSLQEGLKSGRLTPMVTKKGKELLDLTMAGSKKLAGKARVAKGARAASVTAGATTFVFQAAYMLSSMDTLRRLQSIDRKADWLVAARRFDQLGKLERIYTHAAELLHMGDDLPAVANQVHALAAELTELRAVWRQELRKKIQDRDPESIEKDWYLGFGDRKKAGKMEKEANEFHPLHAELQLIQFSFALQWVLMASVGRETVFGKITCKGEQEEWRSLGALVGSKATLIDQRIKEPSRRVKPFSDAVWTVSRLCRDFTFDEKLVG